MIGHTIELLVSCVYIQTVEMLRTYITELLSVDLGLHNVRSVGHCVVLQLVNVLPVVHL